MSHLFAYGGPINDEYVSASCPGAHVIRKRGAEERAAPDCCTEIFTERCEALGSDQFVPFLLDVDSPDLNNASWFGTAGGSVADENSKVEVGEWRW